MKPKKGIFVVPAAVFFLCLCLSAYADDAKPRLITFGDSITNGDDPGDPNDQDNQFRWRDDLQNKLQIGTYDWVGRFASPSAGEEVQTSAEWGKRADEQLTYVNQDMALFYPAGQNAGGIALIHLGTNDVIQYWWDDRNNEGVTNIKEMIRRIHAYDSAIAVYVAKIIPIDNHDTPGGNTPAHWNDIGQNLNPLVDEFNNALGGGLDELRTELTKSNIYTVDVNAAFGPHGADDTAWKSLLSADGVHPNNDGNDRIAQAFGEAIQSHTVTPEPVSSLLFILGGGVLAGKLRRKRAA